MTNQELEELLKQLDDAKSAGGYELPARGDGSGIDPADLESAKTGMVAARSIQFGAGDGSIRGSAEPGSVSTPQPDAESPSPRKAHEPSMEAKTLTPGPDSKEEIAALLEQLKGAQGKDNHQAYSDRGWALARLAGGAVSTQMGHLPEVRIDVPGIPGKAGQVKDQGALTDKMRAGASTRKQNEIEDRLLNAKSAQAEFVLDDEHSLRDPGSKASQIARDAARTVMQQNGQDPTIVHDDMSANDIKQASPSLNNVVKSAIDQANNSEKAKDQAAHNQTTMRNTDVMARAGLGKSAMAISAQEGGAAGKAEADQSKFDIPSYIRTKPVDPVAYHQALGVAQARQDVLNLENKLITRLADSSRPLPIGDEWAAMQNDYIQLQSAENKLQFGGVMRKWDKQWLEQQQQPPTDLLNWVRGSGMAALKEDIKNVNAKADNDLSMIGYHKARPGEMQPQGSASGGAGGSKRAGMDPNAAVGIADWATGKAPPPQLQAPNASRPQPQGRQPVPQQVGQESAADAIRRRQQELMGQ